MADQVGTREAHAEQVGPFMPSELERLDERGGKTADERVGKRTPQPLPEIAVVGLSRRALQCVRKGRRPSGRRRLAGAVIDGGIERRGKEPVPDLAEIGADAVRVEERLDRGHRLR